MIVTPVRGNSVHIIFGRMHHGAFVLNNPPLFTRHVPADVDARRHLLAARVPTGNDDEKLKEDDDSAFPQTAHKN